MLIDFESWLEGKQAAGEAQVFQRMFKGMKDSGIAGVELGPEEMIVQCAGRQFRLSVAGLL